MKAQEQLDGILCQHRVQPVGRGYIDCICPREETEAFVTETLAAGFAISDYSLWQYVASPEEAVQGMGGPRCRDGRGWYSELNVLRPWRGLRELEAFLTEEEKRRGCRLAAGFWLEVPEDWRSGGLLTLDSGKYKRDFYAGNASH